ncbi:MAG: 50S ribosomal protein L15 [candidate division KSB1 bacterium]|nr:50S ribosomal protein L15 [candidate division KSB1 bacterium]MDZ7338221.1 50S ribosomal protein L15 [candidate division KSB1 bacterium]MDZ7384537.1 50S ribosomal protein L15 [candidate division KSB1 bacterium]MDZ7392834.1 50S ribosomal protein L15 [candidate division KSB1 bacterium]MDZ7412574.1 50S ribosomal protein L15 [candidate division KSB1 bacterium]
MNLSRLKPPAGSRKQRKRLGRGDASGHGGTSGRGHKGQHSRSGAKHRAWFEGGQMPLQRRVPKRGFTNPFKQEYQVVNLRDLARLESVTTVDPKVLHERGLIKKKTVPVKILGTGEVTRPLEVSAHAFSKSAREKIESAGGKVTVL